MNETVPSPIPNRQAEQQRDDLSPLSPVILQPPRSDLDDNQNTIDRTNQPASLALPNANPNVKGPISQARADSSRIIYRPSTQDFRGTMIYPSDMLVEVEASEEPTTPTYQKRGRFIVWPVTFNAQDLAIPLGNRV
jgi:hypothetical protein